VEVTCAGDDGLGEVVVRSPALASGYLNAPELTAERFTPDGLRTNDHGWVHDGQLFVAGRADDMVVVAGRNVYARDIEHALVAQGAARAGKCAVVAAEHVGATRLVALVECDAHGAADGREVARRAARAAAASAGTSLERVVLLHPGTLPKTPSGKLQRFRCRTLAQDPGDRAIDTITLTRR
jgi:fatty-acyl-CoA synthase